MNEGEELRRDLGGTGNAFVTNGRRVDPASVHPASRVPGYCLCCMCGTVSPEHAWTYWQRNDEGDDWRMSLPGESDPMMLCPACKWEHRDTDDGSGVYTGTLAEMEAQREADLPDMSDWWTERLAEVAPKRSVG